MKTQITDLVNDSKKICRMVDHPKYANAAPATSHNGYAGTNRERRAEIAAKVAAENNGDMSITINGVTVTAVQYKSLSGKSWSWTAEISREMYESFGVIANYRDVKERYFLTLNGDCTVLVYKGHGTKCNGYIDIDEAFITIN